MNLPRLALLATLSLVACGASQPDATQPQPGGGAAPPPAGDAAPEGGTAPAPPTGEPGAGEEVEGSGPEAPPPYSRVEPPGFVLEQGEGVKISGSIVNTSDIEPVGTLRLEVSVETGPEDLPIQKMVHVEDLEGLGAFSIRVPADLGKVFLSAYFDEDMNGPTPGELGGAIREPLVIGKQAVGDVRIDLAFPLGDPPEGMEVKPGGMGGSGPAAEPHAGGTPPAEAGEAAEAPAEEAAEEAASE
jgi:hypothetical protein